MTNSVKKFICLFENCPKSYKTSSGLSQHKRIHDQKFYFCDFEGCNFQSFCSKSLNRHKSKHSGENIFIQTEYQLIDENFICSMSDCNCVFDDKENLREHQLIEHPNHLEYIEWLCCREKGCDYKTKLRKDLLNHKRHHTRYCAVCRSIFKSKEAFQTHKLKHEAQTIKCKIEGCTQAFKSVRSFRRHELIHKKPLRCTVCEYTADTNRTLIKHKIKHLSVMPFTCMIGECGKNFKTSEYLRKHQLKIHPEVFGAINWLHCSADNCKYKCKSNEQLRSHSHTHFKPFECTCRRRFSSRSALLDHENLHTLKTGYMCTWPDCRGVFPTKLRYKAHLRKHNGLGYQCKKIQMSRKI